VGVMESFIIRICKSDIKGNLVICRASAHCSLRMRVVWKAKEQRMIATVIDAFRR